MSNLWRRGEIPIGVFPRSETLTWFPSDTEENYRERGNKFFSPSDVSYVTNAHGYRSREFTPRVDESVRIMFVGCSFTAGLGVPEEFTWPRQLANMIVKHKRVAVEDFNFGLPGYGIDRMAATILQALPILRPDLVSLFCSLPARFCYFPSVDKPMPLLANQDPDSRLRSPWKSYLNLYSDAQIFLDFVKHLRLIELACDNVPLIWSPLAHFDVLFDIADCDYDAYIRQDNMIPFRSSIFEGELGVDLARDGLHFGIETNQRIANAFFEAMQERPDIDVLLTYRRTRFVS